jgi:hypothetical protein
MIFKSTIVSEGSSDYCLKNIIALCINHYNHVNSCIVKLNIEKPDYRRYSGSIDKI